MQMGLPRLDDKNNLPTDNSYEVSSVVFHENQEIYHSQLRNQIEFGHHIEKEERYVFTEGI